jgi:filamentous hemagglutinin family protein
MHARSRSICSHTRPACRTLPSALQGMKPVVLAVLTLAGTSLGAQPATNQLPVAASGGAAINATVGPIGGTPSNPVMSVTQQGSASNRAVIEWSSFSIGRDARVSVAQPNAQSVLLNRVMSDEVSQIYGGLSANGRVFIVNPFGVLFGNTAQVNVGGLVASSLDLTPAMYAGGYQGFLSSPGVDFGQSDVPIASVESSLGSTIRATQGGSVTLLSGHSVRVGGNIEAPGGRITLAVAPAITVVPVGQSGFVDLAITLPGDSGTISMDGTLNASSSLPGTRGGQVDLRAASIDTFQDGPGVIRADGPAGGGSITLGDGNTRINEVRGTLISANATDAGTGGSVALRGSSIAVDANPLSADGPAGGGVVTVGDASTTSVTIAPGSILRADATDNGVGGSIELRANYNGSATDPQNPAGGPRNSFGVTEVYGSLLARGGPNGGNGGRIETSGAAVSTSLNSSSLESLLAAAIDARARAPGGLSGTWTVDPFDVTITSDAPIGSSSFEPTAPGAVIRAADISSALDSGTSVEISTGSAAVGNQAGDITMMSSQIIRSVGSAPTTLTMRAHGNVTLTQGSTIAVGSGAGPLNVNLYSDQDGNGSGSVLLLGTNIATAGGNLAISGGVDPATGFASAGSQVPGVAVLGSSIDTVGAAGRGNVAIRGSSTGASASAAGQSGVVIDSSSVNAGNISVNGRSGPGTAVLISNSGLRTAAGRIDVRGVATRNLAGGGQAVGVAVSDSFVELDNGTLVVAGRADENGLAASSAATGVQLGGLEVNAAAQSAGRVTIAGHSLGSTGPGIADGVGDGRVFDLVNNNDGLISSAGADVVIGASAAAQAPTLLELDASNTRVLTSGAVNLRPLGVDATGAVVEQPAVPISIGAIGAAPAGSLVVDPTLLQGPNVQSGGLSAANGIVIGSSAHTGLITLGANALPASPTLSLNLQNEGAGSGGLQVGGGNVLGSLALLTAGNVNQAGAIDAQSVLVRGGTGSRIDLSNATNQVGVLAFDPPQFLSVATQGNLTIGPANALGCDVAADAFAPIALTSSVAGPQTVLRSISGNLLLNSPISMPGTGASTLDLVTPANFVVGAGAGIAGGPDSQWRVWAQAPANVVRGNLQAGNLYGCTFGDAATCSLSGVALPSGNRFLFVDRPLLVVTANPAFGVSGQPIPPLTYGFSGVVNGDPGGAVLGGALATAATQQSQAGIYAITQGNLTSLLGYRLQYQGADLVLSLPPTLPPFPTEPRSPIHILGVNPPGEGFLGMLRTDVYGRNLSLPYVCSAASVAGSTVSGAATLEPLDSEWGKVRGLPQLSGCLDVTDGGECAAF